MTVKLNYVRDNDPNNPGRFRESIVIERELIDGTFFHSSKVIKGNLSKGQKVVYETEEEHNTICISWICLQNFKAHNANVKIQEGLDLLTNKTKCYQRKYSPIG